MEIKNIYANYDINRNYPPRKVTVTHVNDVNTRVIELTLKQRKEKLALDSSCTASASFVEHGTNKLIVSGAQCEISESGTILIPIDNLHFRDKMDINVEVSVSDSSGTRTLTLPYPLWIRVNPSVLDNAQVSDKSLGTVPELLEEAKQLVESYRYELTEDDVERIAAEVDVSGKEDAANKKSLITNQSQEGDAYSHYPTIGAVRDFVNLAKADLEEYVDTEIESIPGTTVDSALSQSSTNPVQNKVITAKLNEIIGGKADKATTLSDYGITNAYTKYEVDYALASKANSSAIPTKTSQLNNDSGFITTHQDISGKENTSNKVTAISASSTNAQYPSALAVKNYVDTVIGGIENGSY